MYVASLSPSGVPRILEWEGLRCRWRREGEAWGGGVPLSIGEVSGEGAVPSPENFSYFLFKVPYLDAF